MSKRIKTIFKIPVYFISFLFLISAAGCNTAGKGSVLPVMQQTDLKPKEHRVAIAETRTVDIFINVQALVSYDDFEDLSFKIDNYNLKAVYVKTSDHVEEGQLLAELDASDLEYRIAARQIDLERLQLRSDQIRNNPGMDSADRTTELESLKLDMESIEVDITYLKKLISKTQLIAPFSGVITAIRGIGEPGTTIQAYDTFMTISKPDSIELLSEVLNPYGESDNMDLSGIVTGMKVTLLYGGKNNQIEIPATITRIINTDPGVQNNPARIPASPPPFRLSVKPDGENADKLTVNNSFVLRINTRILENAVVLPRSAIQGFGSDYMVKIVKGEKIVTRRVSTGYVDNKEGIVVITSGLRSGESVILN